MTSVIYASLSAFLIVWLSLNAIKKRHSNKVSIGDGGVEELKLAIAAQSNAIEYIPIAFNTFICFGVQPRQHFFNSCIGNFAYSWSHSTCKRYVIF